MGIATSNIKNGNQKGYYLENFRAVGLMLQLLYICDVGFCGSRSATMNGELKSSVTLLSDHVEAPITSQEVRCAVRFPLSLPVVVTSGADERTALTRNVSASGVLFEMNGPLDVGEDIRFSLRMPGTVLGTPHDVLVHCQGRVVRCSMSQSQYQAAATIDDYQFVEQ
jgi:hypothetical protein